MKPLPFKRIPTYSLPTRTLRRAFSITNSLNDLRWRASSQDFSVHRVRSQINLPRPRNRSMIDKHLPEKRRVSQRPGHMNQEEAACANTIDSHPAVEYWLPNIERSVYSFWLATATGRFYPDFVAELTGDRYLVVEYKGAHILDTADTKAKRTGR